MKRPSLTLVPAALLGALTALPAQAEDLRVTVAEYSAKTGPYFEAVAEAFEAANPGDDIRIEVVPWDVLLQKLTTDISGGANADLSIIGTRWLIDFVEQGIAAPLDEYMSEEFRDSFFPVVLETAKLEGETYGLPIASSARAMFYNETLFERAGIDGPPDTWDELVEDAGKIAALGDDITGFGMQGKEIETDTYFHYALWAQGGELLDADGSSGLDSEAAIRAAEIYKGMIDAGVTQPGVTSYSREDVQNLFKQGKVGMMITAPFLSGQIKEEAPDLQYGIAPIPAGPDGDRGTYGVTDSIILFENSEHKELAWRFVEELFSDENRRAFTSGEGFLPVNRRVAEMPEFADDEDLKAFAEILPDARYAPVIAGWEEVADITSSALQTIYLGDGEIEPTLKAAAERIDGVLGK